MREQKILVVNLKSGQKLIIQHLILNTSNQLIKMFVESTTAELQSRLKEIMIG